MSHSPGTARPLVLVAIVILLAVACEAPAPSAEVPVPTISSFATAASGPTSSTVAGGSPTPPAGRAAEMWIPRHAQPLDYGCGGERSCENLPPDTYYTAGTWAFLQGLTLTIPAGWSSSAQNAGSFELHRAADTEALEELLFWRDPVAYVEGRAAPELGTTGEALAAFLKGDPRFVVTEQVSVPLGQGIGRFDGAGIGQPLNAIALTVTVAPGVPNDKTFEDCPGRSCVGVLIDPRHWDGPMSLWRDMPGGRADCPCSQILRLYLADIGYPTHSHTLAVGVLASGPDPASALATWEPQVQPIIDSLIAPYAVVDN